MVEYNYSDKCKLCPKELTDNSCVGNCIGCKNLFCFNHLTQHHQQFSNDIDQLIKKHRDINDKSFIQLNIDPHLEFIDKWEHKTIHSIHKHTKYLKENITSVFNTCKSQLKEYHTIIEKEVQDKRDLNGCELMQLSQRIEQLDKDIQHVNKILQQITINELNQIVNKYNRATNTIGIQFHFIFKEKSLQWNYLHKIKLDSTYGYMAANNQQIFLGWKNRIVIYNPDGTKHDETRLHSTEIYGELCDIVWSPIMQVFLILCRKSLFVHYPSSSQVKILSEISLINQDNQYISLTTYLNKLYLLNEKSLDLWKLIDKIFLLDNSILISFFIKNSLKENICCVRANEEYLSLLIQNQQTQTWRLDLYNHSPFQRTHTGISFDYFTQPHLGLLMSFHKNMYLFMNWETKLLRIIDQNGTNEILDYNVYNACLLGTQRRIVVNYMTHLKIYEF
jgi:hypothetical protein